MLFWICQRSSQRIPSKKKYKKRRRKGASLIMSRSSKNGTPILQKRRFGGILYWCDWGAPFGALNRVICSAPFLLLFWSSANTPLLELRYYSSFGAPLLLLFWSSVTTILLELCYYSSLIRVWLEHLCYTFSIALLLNHILAPIEIIIRYSFKKLW